MKSNCLLIVVSLVWPHSIQATFEMNGGFTKTMLALSLKSKLIAKNQGNRIQKNSVFQNLSLGGPVSPPSLGHSNEPPRWTHKGQSGTPQKELCKKWEPWTFMPTAKFLKNGHYKICKIKIPILKIPDWRKTLLVQSGGPSTKLFAPSRALRKHGSTQGNPIKPPRSVQNVAFPGTKKIPSNSPHKSAKATK